MKKNIHKSQPKAGDYGSSVKVYAIMENGKKMRQLFFYFVYVENNKIENNSVYCIYINYQVQMMISLAFQNCLCTFYIRRL